MKKTSFKKLTISRQVIRTLQSDDLSRVRGGGGGADTYACGSGDGSCHTTVMIKADTTEKIV